MDYQQSLKGAVRSNFKKFLVVQYEMIQRQNDCGELTGVGCCQVSGSGTVTSSISPETNQRKVFLDKMEASVGVQQYKEQGLRKSQELGIRSCTGITRKVSLFFLATGSTSA